MSGADLGGIPKDYRYWREWHARGFCVACGGMRNAYPYHCDDCYPALANRISQRPMTSSIPPKSEPEQKMSAYDPDLRRSTEWARPSSIPHPEEQEMATESLFGVDRERSTASSRAITEAFVQRIVVEVFGQRVDRAKVVAVAKRIMAALP